MHASYVHPVALETGSGKTRIAADVIRATKGLCIFLAPTNPLVEQVRARWMSRQLLPPRELLPPVLAWGDGTHARLERMRCLGKQANPYPTGSVLKAQHTIPLPAARSIL